VSAEAHKARAARWFEELRDRLTAALEAIEDECVARQGTATAGRFERRAWEREGGGGGVMAILKGQVFEKAGVNVSTVHGEFSPEFRAQIPGAEADARFWASGISVVIHPRSPLIPAAHMNTRHIHTTKAWFGGGADLTPVFPIERDTADFHGALKAAHMADAVIYSVLVMPITNDAGRNVGGENALTTLGERTGGRVFAPSLGPGIDRAFSDILKELRTQYLLAYYPKAVPLTKDPFHRLDVKVRADLRVSARNGYYGETVTSKDTR